MSLHTRDHIERTDVEIDLSQVSFMSAATLSMLLTLRRRLAARGVQLYLTGASPDIERMLVLVGLRETFPVRQRQSDEAGSSW